MIFWYRRKLALLVSHFCVLSDAKNKICTQATSVGHNSLVLQGSILPNRFHCCLSEVSFSSPVFLLIIDLKFRMDMVFKNRIIIKLETK